MPPQVSPNFTVYDKGVGVGSGVDVMVGVAGTDVLVGVGVVVMVGVVVGRTSGDVPAACPRAK